MATATRHCDWCAHRRRYVEGKAESPPCELGHKPRFYRPKDDVDPHDSSWGWKRRCEDFKPKDAHDHQADS